MNDKIRANYVGMEEGASTLEQKGKEYREDLDSLYKTVDELSNQNIWQGEDASTFHDKVYSYKDTLNKLGEAIEAEGKFYRDAKNIIEETQQSLKQDADRI